MLKEYICLNMHMLKFEDLNRIRNCFLEVGYNDDEFYSNLEEWSAYRFQYIGFANSQIPGKRIRYIKTKFAHINQNYI
jgi:hypothetical protein